MFSLSVRPTAVYAASAPDEAFPSVQAGDPGRAASVAGQPGHARVGGYVVHDERG